MPRTISDTVFMRSSGKKTLINLHFAAFGISICGIQLVEKPLKTVIFLQAVAVFVVKPPKTKIGRSFAPPRFLGLDLNLESHTDVRSAIQSSRKDAAAQNGTLTHDGFSPSLFSLRNL